MDWFWATGEETIDITITVITLQSHIDHSFYALTCINFKHASMFKPCPPTVPAAWQKSLAQVAAMRPKFSKAPQGRHRELQGHSATGP
jgi:hypothetical protein